VLSPEDLKAIRDRAEAATHGPWTTQCWDYFNDLWQVIELKEHPDKVDTTFIAHARTDVPALLDTIAEVRAELVEHFDDVDIDYEGKPNDLEYVVSLAGDELKNTRRHSERETDRADVAEHKNSQLRSRFALELAARTTPDMAELQRQANRIIELEDVAKDNQYISETLSRALRVDIGAHYITELVHAAADMIESLKDINGGLRAWQDVARPKLEAERDQALKRVISVEEHYKKSPDQRRMDHEAMLAAMAGHPDPRLHPDKYCTRCSRLGHDSDDCHIMATEETP